MQIKNSCYLITGGSSGLGAAVVERLAQQGAKLVIADIREDPAQWLIEDYPEQITFQHVDVTNASAISRALVALKKRFGDLHGVVNCAGIRLTEDFLGAEEPHRLDSFTRCMHVNLIGSFNVARLAAAQMREQQAEGDKNDPTSERGVIINTASIAAYEGQAGQVAYSAAKAGVIGMMLPMARELAAYGIRVNTIAPGYFKTRLHRDLTTTQQAELQQRIPFPQRLGDAGEFAALVQQIIENRMLNGETIRLDGAMRLNAISAAS